MSSTTFSHRVRVVFIAALLWSIGGQAVAQLAIPDFPLFLTSAGVPPNVVLTLDDSGSMRRGWVPESVTSVQAVIDGARFKSPSVNGLYYNPDIIYQVPTRSDKPSNHYKSYSGATFNFSSIYFNGFDTSKGTVDLQNAYKVVGQSEPSHSYSNCPCYNTNTCNSPNFLSTSNSSGTCRLVKHYPEGDTRSGLTAYYYLYYQDKPGAAKPASCPATPSRTNDNCYVKVVVNATSGPGTKDINGDKVIDSSDKDERQNFANWFAFYRTRAMAVMSGAMSSISTLDNGNVRLGWQTINQCASFGTTCQGYDNANRENRLRTLSSAYKTNFFDWLQRFEVSGNTPLRSALKRAGDYYKSTSLTDSNTPYAEDPYVKAGPVKDLWCRKNFNVLFTDGLWNTSGETFAFPSGNTNPDSSGTTPLGESTTLTDGTVISSYSPIKPYKDVNTGLGYTNANGLADLAFYYWATDLHTGLKNELSASLADSSGTETEQFWNPKNNPASWQHMVNYTIGLGLSASLVPSCYYQTGTGGSLIADPNNPNPGCPAWGGNTYAGDYDKLVAGTRNWPRINTNPTVNEEPDGHVYELWHAAINSRGRFYSADDPAALVSAFQEVMDTISSSAASGGGSRVSTNVARTTETGATAFVALFLDDWSGKLEARPLKIDGSFGTTPDNKPYWWEAGSLIPPGNLPQGAPPFQRKIFTRNNGTAQEFTSCTGNLQTALNKVTKADGTTVTDGLCSQRLAWLRGYTAITGASTWDSVNKTIVFTAPNHGLKANDSVEVTGVTVTGATPSALNKTYTINNVTTHTFTVPLTTNPGGNYVTDEVDDNRSNNDQVRYAGFRDRKRSVLGDIVSAGTVYVHEDNFGYGGDDIKVGGQASYKSYVDGKETNNPPVIYVGANDGMLHAFNADIDVADGGGKELFAYVPSGVYGNLSTLTDPAYGKSHKFFVDGTPSVGDVYLGSWKTYLVGGLRAGGKSIYALDITDPVNFGAANVQWEFNDGTDPLNPGPDMGLTFGQPQIAAVSLTQWAAIFGNGYNSASGNAVLYIVNISSGAPIAKIPVPDNSTSCGSALPANGLSTPFAFDKDGDGVVDVIYAGDLLGHLWRFDQSSGSWDVGNGGDPLFTACSENGQAQSIIAQPKAALINNKITVYFGTGRYLQADPSDPTNPLKNDLISTVVQSFYSIIDESDDSAKQGTVPRDKLLPQTITQSDVTVGVYEAGRTVSNNKVTDPSYSDRTKGCYLDFNTTSPGEPSERITSGVLIKTFTTLETRVIFVTSTPTNDPCGKSGDSWLMELNANCGRLEKTPFGTVDPVTGEFQSLSETTSISGIKLNTQTGQTGLVNEITWIAGPADKGIAFKLLPGTTGKVESVAQSDDKEPPAGGLTPKRISWEQLQ